MYALFLVPCFCFGQQGNIWTFGVGARLDFSNGSGPPTAGTSAISSYEGCATMSDNSGNLIFYTDGVSIFDQNDNIIQTGLSGNWSSAQCGIIVPEPGLTVGSSTGRYFIFSVPALASERVRYTILDYSLGSPVILPANVNLTLPDHTVAQNTCEGLTVARHCNGIDYWLISHEFGNNRFKSYLVSNAGVALPIISNIGPITSPGNGNINSAACMKLSPNNRKLAFIVRTTSVNLFDFNPSNGIVSNQTIVASGSNKAYYGVEFSPNSTILYYTDILTNLFKYNITTTATQAFGNLIGANSSNLYGALQLAPNGNIYMGRDGESNMSIINQSFLGVISNANDFTTSAFAPTGQILIAGTGSKVGLPNVIPTINFSTLSVSNDTLICLNDSVILNVSGGTTYSWSPSIGLSTSVGNVITASPTSSQTYIVSSFDTFGCLISETVTISIDPNCCPNAVLVTNNLTFCQNELISYPDGTTETATNNTTHISNLLTIDGCDSIVTTNVTVIPGNQSIQNVTICFGSNYTYPDGFTSSTVLSNESHNSVFTSSSGCDSIITVNLIVNDGVAPTQQESICSGSNFTFPDGSTQLNITSNISYNSVFQNASDCDSIITTQITVITLPEIDLGLDISKCAEESVTLNGNANASLDFLWNTGATTPSITVQQSGTYSIQVSNACGVMNDSVQVFNADCTCTFYLPNTFTPDEDEYNQTFGAEYDCKLSDFEMQIYNRWGEMIFQNFNVDYKWDGTYDGKIVPQGTYTYKIKYTSNLGEYVHFVGHVNVLR